MIKLRVCPNLAVTELALGEPWEFLPDDEALAEFTGLKKTARRALLIQDTTLWQCYTGFEGFAPNLRIDSTNPATRMNAYVVDYDTKMSLEFVIEFLSKNMKAELLPNYIEQTPSGNIRLVWLFEASILLPSPSFTQNFLDKLSKFLNSPTLLAGFDAHSHTPSELWTNGGRWAEFEKAPLPYDLLRGFAIEAGDQLEDIAEIPLEIIATEVEARWPGRWSGPFVHNAQGVRFWDPNADNPTGCQVKGDGMLCFTGPFGFRTWEDIFGRQWVEEHRALNKAKMAAGVYFEGREFYIKEGTLYQPYNVEETQRELRTRGVSTKLRKGETASDMDLMIRHIQQHNRIEGAGPMVSFPPGVVSLRGKNFLNTADIQALPPVRGEFEDERDFPWIWKIFGGFFAPADPKKPARDYFFEHMRRAYDSQLNHKGLMGQALFLCGPADSGKTLVILRVYAALLGGRYANPWSHFLGNTEFNSELFESPLLIVNDEEAPSNDSQKVRINARIKSIVVNPTQRYHAKFRKPVTIDWIGRFLMSLNDEASDTYALPEKMRSTEDKMMFFRILPAQFEWPEKAELEAIIAKELPKFGWWLLNKFQPASGIRKNSRMGMHSYFDPKLVDMAGRHTYSFNLRELITEWMDKDEYWQGDTEVWNGSPTQLAMQFNANLALQPLMKDWSPAKIARALATLAKSSGTGVTMDKDDSRKFRIVRDTEDYA